MSSSIKKAGMVITTTRPMYIIQIRRKRTNGFFMHWELGILKRQKKSKMNWIWNMNKNQTAIINHPKQSSMRVSSRS